jgi:hypothetical protein
MRGSEDGKPNDETSIVEESFFAIPCKDNLLVTHWQFPSAIQYSGRSYISKDSKDYKKMCYLVKLGSEKPNNNYDSICLSHW